jgi:hypothetical protein
MQRFKFLTKAKPIEYNGEWSRHVIGMVYDYINNRYRDTYISETFDAKYIITETTYELGQLSRAVVKVYPNRDTNMIITYWVTVANTFAFITNHTIENI